MLEMAPFYSWMCPQLKWTPDSKLLKGLQDKNTAELKRLDEKIVDAETNLGETDVSNALIEKAQYLARIGDKEKSLSAYRLAFDKTGPLGQRIDIVFAILRIGFFFDDGDVVFRNIDKAKS
jgi:26S proteasome regulatory subunit N7